MAPVSGSTSLLGFIHAPRPAMVRPYWNWARDARSAIERRFCGDPATKIPPSPSSTRSFTLTSSSSEASWSTLSRASIAASRTALPTRCVARDANVPMSWGPVSVSAVWMTTWSYGTPRVSAAIWAITVRSPWPRSVAASTTLNDPDVVAWTSAWDGSPPRFMPVG